MSDKTQPAEEDLGPMMFDYLGGGLSADQSARFEAMLEARPELRAECADWQALRHELELRRQERAPEAGLDAFTRRMRAARAPRKAGIGEWIERWIRPLYSPQRFAAALLLVAVQAGFLAALLTQSGADEIAGDPATTQVRSIGGPGAVALRVRFRPEATAREIAATLSNAGARIVDGPGQGGFYTLSFAADSRNAALLALRQSSAIDELVEAPNPPSPAAGMPQRR